MKGLIPFVEKKYRVISARHGRVIAGLSMGGYGAIKLAIKYPNLFYFAGFFSGAFGWSLMIEKDRGLITQSLKEAFGEKRSKHWDANDVFALIDSLKSNLPYFYISCGENDQLEGLLESNRKFVEKLQMKGIIYEYYELPGGHDWYFWDSQIKLFLNKLNQFKN